VVPTGTSPRSPPHWFPARRAPFDISNPLLGDRHLACGGRIGGLGLCRPAGWTPAKTDSSYVPTKDVIVVAFRDTVAAVGAALRRWPAATSCGRLHAWADAGGAGAEFVGIPGAGRSPAPAEKEAAGGRNFYRPEGARAAWGCRPGVDVDTRFHYGVPAPIKKIVMVGGCADGSLFGDPRMWPRWTATAGARSWSTGGRRSPGSPATAPSGHEAGKTKVAGRRHPRPGLPTRG